MKTALLYNLVEQPTDGGYMPANWHEVVKRFARAYRAFDAGCAHELYICTSGGSLSETSRMALDGLCYESFTYAGRGWDIGAYQWSASRLKGYNMLVCLNSQAHPARAGWLARIADAWDRHGPGIYGASSSFEGAPHVRTSCIATAPALLQTYPLIVRSRYDACVFEHSPRNFSLWAQDQGLPVYVVLASGAVTLENSRQGPEVFRKGGQSDLLVHDRHTLLYDAAGPAERRRLQALADGEMPTQFVFLGPIDRLCDRHRLPAWLRAQVGRLKAARH